MFLLMISGGIKKPLLLLHLRYQQNLHLYMLFLIEYQNKEELIWGCMEDISPGSGLTLSCGHDIRIFREFSSPRSWNLDPVFWAAARSAEIGDGGAGLAQECSE